MFLSQRTWFQFSSPTWRLTVQGDLTYSITTAGNRHIYNVLAYIQAKTLIHIKVNKSKKFTEKLKESRAVVVHVFNPSTQEAEESGSLKI